MTHDLLRNLISEIGFRVQKVTVNDLLENTFYAMIEQINDKEQVVSLDARPSDAIALALRADCPIYVAQKVLDVSNSSSTQNKLDDEIAQTLKPGKESHDVID